MLFIQSFSIHGEREIHSFTARKGIDCMNNILNPRYRAGGRDYEDQTTDKMWHSLQLLDLRRNSLGIAELVTHSFSL